jgi:hypothetical protein
MPQTPMAMGLVDVWTTTVLLGRGSESGVLAQIPVQRAKAVLVNI